MQTIIISSAVRQSITAQSIEKDWRQIAEGAWNSLSWREAAEQYHRDRAGLDAIAKGNGP